jgi:hypothetical protein
MKKFIGGYLKLGKPNSKRSKKLGIPIEISIVRS